jgi:hypothetical protein
MSQINNSSLSNNNLFSGKNQDNQNNQEFQMESKFQTRQEQFSQEDNLSKIKESAMSQELSLSQDTRNKYFLQKRLHKKTNIESNVNLLDSLTMPKDVYEKISSAEIQPSDFNNIINLFHSQNIDDKFKGLVGIRKLLSIESHPPIQEIIDLKIVPELINLLENTPNEFKYEAVWSLTNIATGEEEQANTILIYNGIPKILDLLDSNIEEIKSQTVWLIANLIGESTKIRDTLINQKVYDKLLTILASTNHQNYIDLCTWAINNFFKVKPIPNYDIAFKAFKIIARVVMIYDTTNTEFIADACQIFSIITKKYKAFIKEIVDINLLPYIIKFLDIDNKKVKMACLKIVGNIACEDNANQVQKLIDLNVLEKLKYALFHENIGIRRESAFILSNIAAGTQKQIEILIEQNFLQILFKVFKNDSVKVQKEAIYAIGNLTSVENEKYMKKLIDDGILIFIYDSLKSDDCTFISISLEILGNVLAFGKKKGQIKNFMSEIEKLGIIDILEKLQVHEDQVIYEKTMQIVDNYLEIENS